MGDEAGITAAGAVARVGFGGEEQVLPAIQRYASEVRGGGSAEGVYAEL